MASVVFLRAVNVGGTNRCRPAAIARELAKFDVVNIGAVGTFVVRERVTESALRTAIARRLPFACEIMIVPAKEIIDLVQRDPFARQPSDPGITRFVNVLHKPLRSPNALELAQPSNIKLQTSHRPSLPISLPTADNWLLKIIAIENRFVLGLYRREMKAISYLGKIEKQFGGPATTRNWNTIEKVMKILGKNSPN